MAGCHAGGASTPVSRRTVHTLGAWIYFSFPSPSSLRSAKSARQRSLALPSLRKTAARSGLFRATSQAPPRSLPPLHPPTPHSRPRSPLLFPGGRCASGASSLAPETPHVATRRQDKTPPEVKAGPPQPYRWGRGGKEGGRVSGQWDGEEDPRLPAGPGTRRVFPLP